MLQLVRALYEILSPISLEGLIWQSSSGDGGREDSNSIEKSVRSLQGSQQEFLSITKQMIFTKKQKAKNSVPITNFLIILLLLQN